MDSYKKSRRKSIIAWVIAFVLAIGAAIVSFTPFIFMVLNSFKEKFEMLTKVYSSFLINWTGPITLRYLQEGLQITSRTVWSFLQSPWSCCCLFQHALLILWQDLSLKCTADLCDHCSLYVYSCTYYIDPCIQNVKSTGLYDTIWSLIGPYVAFAVPISVFILTSFMKEIPREIEESAEIDGCGKIQMFFSMILPLSKPGMATLAIYNGVNMWNEFSFVNTLTQSAQNRTLPLAIWEFQGQYSMNTPMIMAVSYINTFYQWLSCLLFSRINW